MTNEITKSKTWTTGGTKNLIRHRAGTYYARFTICRVPKLFSLKTSIYAVAKLRLEDEMRKVGQARGSAFAKAASTAKMADLIQIYRHRFQSRPLALSTHTNLDQALLRLVKSWPEFETLLPRSIRAEEVWAWANRLYRDGTGFRPPQTIGEPKIGLGAGSVNRSIFTLQVLLDIALEMGAIHQNVARGRPPAGYGSLNLAREALPVHLPSQDVIQRLFTAIETPATDLPARLIAAQRYHRINAGELCRFLAYSGARLGEASRATWADDRQTYLIIHGTKSRCSKERTVHMNSSLRMLLDQIRQRRCEGISKADGLPPQAEEPILRVAEAQITLTRACESIGAPRLTHHDFRHLFATRCLEVGIAPNIVADWMGHADGGVLVLQTYGHVRPGQAAAAASTLTF